MNSTTMNAGEYIRHLEFELRKVKSLKNLEKDPLKKISQQREIKRLEKLLALVRGISGTDTENASFRKIETPEKNMF